MSPEQVEGGTIDTRSDLYSLGLVLYEMVAGDVPFAGDSTWQVMYQRVKERPKDVKAFNPQVPDNVARTIMHCLEKNPADRYQTAREILADLDAGRAPSLSLARSIQMSMPRVVAGPGHRWKYAAMGAAVFALILFFSIPKTRHLVFRNAPAAALGSASPGVPGLPSLAQGKFIAVLPFRVLGDQSSLGYVAEGLGEALSAKLFQLKDVRVASTAAAAKTDPKTPLPDVAKELGVNVILHGTVQGAADNLRVTVNLENVAENRLILSQEFPGVTGDLLTAANPVRLPVFAEKVRRKSPLSRTNPVFQVSQALKQWLSKPGRLEVGGDRATYWRDYLDGNGIRGKGVGGKLEFQFCAGKTATHFTANRNGLAMEGCRSEDAITGRNLDFKVFPKVMRTRRESCGRR